MTTLSKRSFNKDGFQVDVSRAVDENPDISYLEQDYKDESPADRAKYKAQDQKRLKGLRNGDWHYIGICVDVRKQTPSNWADGGLVVGRASCWGFESDSTEGHLKSEEEDLIAEAFAEVDRLKRALADTEVSK